MFNYKYPNNLKKVKRLRIEENRNLIKGLRLDRNERVENWDKSIKNIFLKAPNYFFSIYPDLSKLYKKIAKFDNIKINQLLVTSGIDGGIKTFFETFIRKGDLVGVVKPTYAMYQVYAKIFDSRIEQISYIDKKFNFEKFEKFIKKKPKVFFLPNPNQPIEDNFDLKNLEIIAKKLLKINCVLFVDEAYYLFGQKSAKDLIKKYKNLVVARTFSKGFGLPSIRLGYLISNSKMIDILSKSRLAHETNSLSSFVASYYLDNFKIIKKYINDIKNSRKFLLKELKKLSIKAYAEKGNFMLIELTNPKKVKNVVNRLKKELIYVKGPWSYPYDNCFSITIGPQKKMKIFLKLIKKII